MDDIMDKERFFEICNDLEAGRIRVAEKVDDSGV